LLVVFSFWGKFVQNQYQDFLREYMAFSSG
jgi:hypothetical protein